MADQKIVLAHDYVTQKGGAERVALALARAFAERPMLTALYDQDSAFPGFIDVDLRPSLLNRFGIFRRNPQLALPLLPLAWSLRKRVAADVVIASSSGWAHGVRASKGALKVVYCHNPPRWLYQPDEYLIGRSTAVRLALRALRPFLLAWDRKASNSVDVYIANSNSVAGRIRKAYRREPEVIYPPVTVNGSDDRKRPSDAPNRFFLTVGRRRGYKGTSRLIAAFARMPEEHLVVVGGSADIVPPNVSVLEDLEDAEMRWLYANATALLSVSKEDFGLTPIEANSLGTPVLVVKAGGFLDSVAEGISGLYFEGDAEDDLVSSVRNFPEDWDRAAIEGHAANFGQEAFAEKLRAIVENALSARADGSDSALLGRIDHRSGARGALKY